MAENPFAKYVQRGDPVIAPPDPYKQSADARDNQRLNISQEELRIRQQEAQDRNIDRQMKLEDRNRERQKFANAKRDALQNTIDMLRRIDVIEADARDNGGWLETGRSGALVRGMPKVISAGSAAYDLEQSLKTLDANMAFGALQRMREASPTGGALGAVSDTELGLLRSSIANLDPNQSQETFVNSLGQARRAYLNVLRNLNPKAADAYERVRNKPKGAPSPRASGGPSVSNW